MEWIQQYGRFCRDCEYWQGVPLTSRKSKGFKGVKGTCHRFPPYFDSSSDKQWSKPITLDSDGCGEFKLISHLQQNNNEGNVPDRGEMASITIETNEDCLINVKQIAEILNVGVSHIHTMRSCGQIPLPMKLGGSIRWNKREIVKWINSGCPSLNKWEVIKNRK